MMPSESPDLKCVGSTVPGVGFMVRADGEKSEARFGYTGFFMKLRMGQVKYIVRPVKEIALSLSINVLPSSVGDT